MQAFEGDNKTKRLLVHWENPFGHLINGTAYSTDTILRESLTKKYGFEEREQGDPWRVPSLKVVSVFDTGVEDLPDDMCSNRPWGKGNNPKTAVYEYLRSTDCFEIDKSIEHKLLITAAPEGYLRKIK